MHQYSKQAASVIDSYIAPSHFLLIKIKWCVLNSSCKSASDSEPMLSLQNEPD